MKLLWLRVESKNFSRKKFFHIQKYFLHLPLMNNPQNLLTWENKLKINKLIFNLLLKNFVGIAVLTFFSRFL